MPFPEGKKGTIMSTYIPDAVQAGLDAARRRDRKRATGLRIEGADGYCRLLRMWEDGFSIALEDAPHLRGFVDIYEGSRHLFQCLIVASAAEGDEMHYEFKRMTAVTTQPPRDFVAPNAQAAGLIEGPRPA